jgi:protein-L-isoaspartate(D-aspartate) O-methyltransferase
MVSFEEKRRKLVEQLQSSGRLTKRKVILAMLKVPREYFVPKNRSNQAYIDTPLSIFEGQTISAPHMNAMMCELLDLNANQKILEIGTGSGYHAALCAHIINQGDNVNKSGHVYSIERREKLVAFARDNLKQAGMELLVTVIHADGTLGYPNNAPYDRILVTAAGPNIPQPLIDQLKIGGKLCIPVGESRLSQELMILTKTHDGVKKEHICNVVFVPLIGKYGFD